MDFLDRKVEIARGLLLLQFDSSPLTLNELWRENEVDLDGSIPYIKENLASRGWKEIGELTPFPALYYIWFFMANEGMAKIIAAGAYALVVHGPADLWDYMDRMSSGFCGVLGRSPDLPDWRERLTVTQRAVLAEVFGIAYELHEASSSEEDRNHMLSLASCMRRSV